MNTKKKHHVSVFHLAISGSQNHVFEPSIYCHQALNKSLTTVLKTQVPGAQHNYPTMFQVEGDPALIIGTGELDSILPL